MIQAWGAERDRGHSSAAWGVPARKPGGGGVCIFTTVAEGVVTGPLLPG